MIRSSRSAGARRHDLDRGVGRLNLSTPSLLLPKNWSTGCVSVLSCVAPGRARQGYATRWVGVGWVQAVSRRQTRATRTKPASRTVATVDSTCVLLHGLGGERERAREDGASSLGRFRSSRLFLPGTCSFRLGPGWCVVEFALRGFSLCGSLSPRVPRMLSVQGLDGGSLSLLGGDLGGEEEHAS